MTAVKPKKNHPWCKAIHNDSQAANIRRRIKDLNEQIKMLKIEIKMNETKLKELTENGKQ